MIVSKEYTKGDFFFLGGGEGESFGISSALTLIKLSSTIHLLSLITKQMLICLNLKQKVNFSSAKLICINSKSQILT